MPPYRPPIPANDTTNDVQLIQLMRDCWDENPTQRPDFSTIRNRFLFINKGKYDIITSYRENRSRLKGLYIREITLKYDHIRQNIYKIRHRVNSGKMMRTCSKLNDIM